MPRLTLRELEAIAEALNRCLAGEPETDEEDVAGMEKAHAKVWAMVHKRRDTRTANRQIPTSSE